MGLFWEDEDPAGLQGSWGCARISVALGARELENFDIRLQFGFVASAVAFWLSRSGWERSVSFWGEECGVATV